jgi:hypothetical protein
VVGCGGLMDWIGALLDGCAQGHALSLVMERTF